MTQVILYINIKFFSLTIKPFKFKTVSNNSEKEETSDDDDTKDNVKPEPNEMYGDIWKK